MKKSAIFAALLALSAAPAFANANEYLTVDEIATATGMAKNEVRLMVGAVSNNPLYLTSYERVNREWKDAIKESGLIVEKQRRADGRIALQVRRARADEV